MAQRTRAQIEAAGWTPLYERGRVVVFHQADTGGRILWDSQGENVYRYPPALDPDDMLVMFLELALVIKQLVQNPDTQTRAAINTQMSAFLRDLIAGDI